ncbi:MAG: hypothetical protein U1G07_17890 [Verrucomicrobiota bacterium]
MLSRHTCLVTLAALSSGFVLLAAENPSDPGVFGHSMHGEAFDEGPRQAAYLMQGMPRSIFR